MNQANFYRMARFAAEFKGVKSKLLARIEYLETQLAKYQTNDSSANPKDDYQME